MNFPDRFPVLTTARLALRETAERDAEDVFAMESDPVAMRYWSHPPMQEISEARDAVERALGYFRARTALRWAITRPIEDRLIGHVSLFSFSEQNRRAEIGYD
jgi:RimJ/RimL family protein N-acetyltransferase